MADRPGRLVARNVDRGTELGADVEVAASFWARFRGLMLRPPLPPGGGLWLRGNGIHMLFMRFPLDVVFLGREDTNGLRRVVAVREALPAWIGLVPLVRGAEGCLELPVGALAASGTQVGDQIVLEPVEGSGAAAPLG